jgi:hypothetical protein
MWLQPVASCCIDCIVGMTLPGRRCIGEEKRADCKDSARYLSFHNILLHVCYLKWKDNIKMGLQEVGGGCGDWVELAQDRERWRAPVSTVMNFRVP